MRAHRANHTGTNRVLHTQPFGRGLHGSKAVGTLMHSGFTHTNHYETDAGSTDYFDAFSKTSTRNHPGNLSLTPRTRKIQNSRNRGGAVFTKYIQHCIEKDVDTLTTGHFGCGDHDLGLGWK
jgi:hypothetical protein